tara:strand:- start:227 stop:532 length:306 start_codon:yes stop_codon:yes gene_type:complete
VPLVVSKTRGIVKLERKENDMVYAVMRLNSFSHIDDTYTCVFNSADRYKCIAYIKAQDDLSSLTQSDEKYFIFTRIDVIPEGSVDNYITNEDVYKSMQSKT